MQYVEQLNMKLSLITNGGSTSILYVADLRLIDDNADHSPQPTTIQNILVPSVTKPGSKKEFATMKPIPHKINCSNRKDYPVQRI